MAQKQIQKMKKTRVFRIFSCILLFFAVLSCSSADKIAHTERFFLLPDSVRYERAGNAEYAFVKENDVKFHVVKIDLSSENVEILAYPTKTESGKLGRSKKFAKLTGAEIAVNTSPFTRERTIMGIHLIDGEVISRAIHRYGALVFFRDKNGGFFAKIIKNQTEENLLGADFAFGGFFQILSNGEKVDFATESFDARSAVGVSADGRTIFLLVAEKGFGSRGLSFQECAEIFLSLGAFDALEFDGGSSSSLFVSKKNVKYEASFRRNESYMGFCFR